MLVPNDCYEVGFVAICLAIANVEKCVVRVALYCMNVLRFAHVDNCFGHVTNLKVIIADKFCCLHNWD